jgi:hypothetical protein
MLMSPIRIDALPFHLKLVFASISVDVACTYSPFTLLPEFRH